MPTSRISICVLNVPISLVRLDLENVTSLNGEPLSVSLGKSSMKFTIESRVFPFEAHVISGLTYDVILG